MLRCSLIPIFTQIFLLQLREMKSILTILRSHITLYLFFIIGYLQSLINILLDIWKHI